MALNKSVRNLNYKINFSYWLAGLIDGDGYLGISKKGYTCCEISVGVTERSLLLCVQKKVGGTITLRSNANSYRWLLHNRNGMVALVEHINGKCILRSKQAQLRDLSECLDIPFKVGAHLSIDTFYTCGLFEAEGYFNINTLTLQCSVTISQKDPEYLHYLKGCLGGNVFYDKYWNGFLYSASDESSLDRWFAYFSQFPLISRKNQEYKRFKRIVLYKRKGYHRSKNPAHVKRFRQSLDTFKARRYSP